MSQENHFDPTSQESNLLDTIPGRAFAAAVITTEVSPLNEVLRGAITVGAGVLSKDPIVTAAVFAASTAAIEGGAALVTAEVLESKSGKKFIGKINDKLQTVGISEDARTNTVTDLGVSLLGGSAVAMLVKQAQDPTRDKNENRSFGLKMTAGTSLICGGLGYVAAEGIANPNFETVGAATIAIGGIATFAGWAKKRLSK